MLVGPNTQVGARAPLVQIDEPDDGGPDGGERVRFESTGEELPEAPERCPRTCAGSSGSCSATT